MIKYRIVLTESEREGLKSLLSKGRHTARKLTRARLIAEVCRSPGEGHARWALKLLAGRVVERGLAESMSPETVRAYLKKTTSSPGRSRKGAFPR